MRNEKPSGLTAPTERSGAHAPGPWTARELLDSPGNFAWVVDSSRRGAGHVAYLPRRGQVEANAKLIAAAPALADALAEYIAELDRDGLPSPEWSDANLAKMRAALALAGRNISRTPKAKAKE